MVREALSRFNARFWAYFWRGHDPSTLAEGGQGARHLFLAGSVGCVALLAAAFPVQHGDVSGEQASPMLAQAPHPLIGKYCMGCHDSVERTAGLAFDEMKLDKVEGDREHWEAVVRRLASGMMPPLNSPRPSPGETAELIQAITFHLDDGSPPPAPTVLRRLTRTEYKNVVRDLLGLDVDVTTLLPPDPSSRGFDNIAEVLTTSPALVQGYLNAGMKISRQAVGDPSLPPSRQVFVAPAKLNNDDYIEGLPLGTRGGMQANVLFPLNGEYEIEVRSGPGASLFKKFGPGVMPDVDFTVAGKPFALDEQGRARVRINAGTWPVTAALRDRDIGPGVSDIFAEYNIKGAILEIAVNGPFNSRGVGSTASRKKIFLCYPDRPIEERACARRIVGQLARRAFRHPVEANGEDMATLMRHYDLGRAEGTFESGIQRALAYILVDPRFLYKMEYEPSRLAPGETYAVSPIELASRLSFFIWSSIPDDELFTSAVSGRLTEEGELRRQVRRMMADPRAMALVDNFGKQWLHLQQIDAAERESRDFDDNLKHAMVEETRLLLADVFLGNRPVVELLQARHTHLNERLARHYGIRGVEGDYFRRVSLPVDSPRRGLLGQGSILTVTSVANRTSPVIRGAWLLENILGVPPSPPPPGVETNLEEDEAPRSLRDRLARHREDAACASCHNMMDPLGLTLENFDNTGKWRTRDGTFAIDASAVLLDGTPINGVADLRHAMIERSDSFVANLTSKLMMFALGRPTGPREMPAVRRVLADTEGQNHRFRSLVEAIVTSEPFLTRTKPAQELRTGPVRITRNQTIQLRGESG